MGSPRRTVATAEELLEALGFTRIEDVRRAETIEDDDEPDDEETEEQR